MFSRFFSKRPALIVGLDIGTSLVKLAVGERRPDGCLTLLGAHHVESRGLRRGEVMDHNQASSCVFQAIRETEELLNMEIGKVEVALTGGHIESANHRGTVPIRSATGQISPDDVEDAVEAARGGVSISEGRVVFHVIRQQYYVDGKDGVANPVGLVGRRLEADTHMVHGVGTRLQNTLQCLHSQDGSLVDVGSHVFSGLASSLAVLGRHEKEMGVILLDIGAGTTEYVAYSKGMIRQMGVLPVAGDHLLNDILLGLKIQSRRLGEALIHEHGCVWPEPSGNPEIKGKTVSVKTSELLPDRERVIPLEYIHAILYHRMDETLRIVRERLHAQGSLNMVASGVVLTGGVSRLPGIVELTQSVFGMPAVVGIPQGFDGIMERAAQPEMATVLGLLKYAALRGAGEKRESNGFWDQFKKIV
ncbi:MAG: cell division protein FtsA [Verrucomicrobiae bacterium]|nr:cell division protein FtsA [Verrucomicrobiae bacterium]